MSGDGVENIGDDTADARDAAIAAGVDQINGLYILGDPQEDAETLRDFCVNDVVGGVGGFASSVQSGHTDLDKFAEAVNRTWASP